MAEKSAKRVKKASVLLRMLPQQKEYLDAAAQAAEVELQRKHPGATMGTGPYLIGLGLQDAEKKLGQNIEAFLNDKAREPYPTKGKK